MNLFSKKIFNLGTGIAVLILGIFIGSFLKENPIAVFQKSQSATGGEILPKEKELFTPVSGEVSGASAVSSTDLSSKFTPSGDLAKVTRVVDGDTINVEINGKIEAVRYIGIDTPETVDPRKTVQCFGVEASKKNRELVEGKMVRLEKDITDRDKYNRLLRYVYLTPQINADTKTRMNADKSGETFVNLALVEQGFARSYSYPPDVKYQEQLRSAEQKAREGKIGLWGSCPSFGSTVTPADTSTGPASVSETPAPNANSNSGSSCQIKGNISAGGEKIYHLPGCGSYTKTQINEAQGEKWFCSEAEALSAGWRKAGNCS